MGMINNIPQAVQPNSQNTQKRILTKKSSYYNLETLHVKGPKDINEKYKRVFENGTRK